jgi:hypothetical protein
MKKLNSIIITCYNREEALEKCFNNLLKADQINNFNIVIVRQRGFDKVKALVKNFNFKNKYIIETDYLDDLNPNKKMAYNGYKGCDFAFSKLDPNYICYLEDDIIVSKDFFNFHNFLHKKFLYDPNFFGVNGFSKEPYIFSKINLYSKFVYGLGKGYSFNSNIWNIIKEKIWNKEFFQQDVPYLDSPIENYIKKNNYFVIMPILSRIYEFPTEGTNISLKNNLIYFKKFKESFVGENHNKNEIYRYSFTQRYTWRSDCKKYLGSFLNQTRISLKKFIKLIYKFC